MNLVHCNFRCISALVFELQVQNANEAERAFEICKEKARLNPEVTYELSTLQVRSVLACVRVCVCMCLCFVLCSLLKSSVRRRLAHMQSGHGCAFVRFRHSVRFPHGRHQHRSSFCRSRKPLIEKEKQMLKNNKNI